MSRRARHEGYPLGAEKRRSLSSARARPGLRRLYCRRLGYETLEDRRLLAILTVNTLADGILPGDGFVTLREAIDSANFGAVTDLGDVPDPGFDEIVFDPALDGGTIALAPILGTLPIMDTSEIDASALPSGLTVFGENGFDFLPGTGDGFSVFTVDDLIPGPTITVELIGLTLTGGDTPLVPVALDGGAVWNAEVLTVTECTITGNVAGGDGGGIFNSDGFLTVAGSTIVGNMAAAGAGGGIGSLAPAGAVAVTLSTITGNVAATFGGGVDVDAGDAFITSSTIAENTAGADGGGLFKAGPPSTLAVTGSTFSDNAAAADGGGIWVMTAPGATTTITNSTISGNTAEDNGGGVYAITLGAGIATIEHNTITGNFADADGDTIGVGGGLFALGAGVPLVDHTIVAANLNGPPPAGPLFDDDVGGPGFVDSVYSLIGIDTTGTITDLGFSLIGAGVPIAPLLAPLSNNGGPTFTHRLLPLSPAIDAGDPAYPGPLTEDQRGAPFLRVFDGDGDTIAVIDIGAYELQTLATPPSFTVDTLVDENDGDYSAGDFSLREAIGLANGSVGGFGIENITLAPALAGGTITLDDLLGELAITDAVEINTIGGPGGLTIDASDGPDDLPGTGDGYRIFNIEIADPFSPGGVTLGGLTLTGGDVTGPGGAIRNMWLLSVISSVITGNATSGLFGFGGGIYGAGSSTTNIGSSTISGNSTSGAFSPGGGIATTGPATLFIQRSTISGNSTAVASSPGGGIWATAAYGATVTDSTISGNTSASDGGGIWASSSLTVESSTISTNSAAGDGGGMRIDGGLIAQVVRRSTITGNTAGGGGEGIFWAAIPGAALALDHTIVAANTAGGGVDVMKSPFIIGTVTASYSLIGVAAVGAIVNAGGSSLIGTGGAPIVPGLGPLAANGGPTMTHAPLAGSLAIEAGDPAAVGGVGGVPLYDQRFQPWTRVYDGNAAGIAVIDIGAVEYHPTTPTPRLPSGDYNSNRVVDAADYVVWRRTFGTNGVTAYSGADGDGDGTIDGDDYNVWRANFGLIAGAGSGESRAAVSQAMPDDRVTTSSTAAANSPSSTSVVSLSVAATAAPAATHREPPAEPLSAVADRPATSAALPREVVGNETAPRQGGPQELQIADSGLRFRGSREQAEGGRRKDVVRGQETRARQWREDALVAWLATRLSGNSEREGGIEPVGCGDWDIRVPEAVLAAVDSAFDRLLAEANEP